MKIRSKIAVVAAVPLLLSACTTDPYIGEKKVSKTAIGAGIGAVVGALGGAAVGGDKKRKEILIGAGIGALAGGGIGAYMDAQDRKLREKLQGMQDTLVGAEDGSEAFARLARIWSSNESARRGGLMKELKVADLAEDVRKAIDGVAVGGVSEIVGTSSSVSPRPNISEVLVMTSDCSAAYFNTFRVCS